jgi:hypothetical protein
MKVELALDDKDFKTTKKISWLAVEPNNQIPCELQDIDHLITKDKLEDTDVFEDFVNPNTLTKTNAYDDMNLRTLERGEIIQIERKGFYIVERQFLKGEPMQLISIPDGRIAREVKAE